jgi:hypothetical protein
LFEDEEALVLEKETKTGLKEGYKQSFWAHSL